MVLVVTVPVGGLHDHIIRLGENAGILDQRPVPLADVSRKDHPVRGAVFGHQQLDHRGTQDVPRVVKHSGKHVIDPNRLVVANSVEQRQRPIHILFRVKRDFRMTAASPFLTMPTALVFDVFHLDAGRIMQHHVRQVDGGMRAEDRRAEAFGDQSWDQTAVIDVDMGQQQGIQLQRIDRTGLPIPVQIPPLLGHAVIDHDARSVRFNTIP